MQIKSGNGAFLHSRYRLFGCVALQLIASESSSGTKRLIHDEKHMIAKCLAAMLINAEFNDSNEVFFIMI